MCLFLPFWAAHVNAVSPRAFTTLTSAPFWMSISAIVSCPKRRKSGVFNFFFYSKSFQLFLHNFQFLNEWHFYSPRLMPYLERITNAYISIFVHCFEFTHTIHSCKKECWIIVLIHSIYVHVFFYEHLDNFRKSYKWLEEKK